jgi:uncharacterized protein with ParB-like and HNH nuclease domain
MNITPNKLTINQLLSAKNEQFVIPPYQRRFAWKPKHVGALFEDIEILKDDDGHLFGTLLFHTGFLHGGINRIEVVDGQQRITTLAVLLRAIQQRYKALKKKFKVDEINNLLICIDPDDKIENKVILGDLDNKDFIRIMKHNINNISNKNLLEAYNYFSETLSSFGEESLNKFYYKLTNVAIVIRLDVSQPKDAYKLFETINNRGLRLSATDIIKNFLLGHAAKIDKDEVLEEVKEKWSKIIMALDDIDTDDFFRQYMCSILKKKVSLNNLVREFKEYYLNHVEKAELLGEFAFYAEEEEDEDESSSMENEEENNQGASTGKMSIIDFLDKINKTAEVYRKITFASFENKEINRHCVNLHNILSKPSYIFLMQLMQTDLNHKQFKIILRAVETFMLKRHVCEMRTGELDFIFSRLVREIEKDDIPTSVIDKLKEDLPEDNDFESSLPKAQFKGMTKDRAKYILEQIEYYKSGNTGEFYIAKGHPVHLEHIIPETITTKRAKSEFGNWEEYLGENAAVKHKKYVNMIGNMTLLAESLNIQAYNNPFAKKKSSYKKSAIRITNELANQNNFKFYHVDKRGEELAKIALKIWKL